MAAAGFATVLVIGAYAALNDSGHTAWEPYTSLLLFVPLTVGGVAGLAARHRFAGLEKPAVLAVAAGLAGIALIVLLDQANLLVNYDRWIDRGMP